MSEAGTYIKSKREELNISYEELYERTKIRVLYLKAIEEGNFDELPGEVYLRGFLRTISRELNLDCDHVLGLYEAEYKKLNNIDSTLEESKKTSESNNSSTSNVVVWVIVGILIIGGAIAYFLTQKAPGSILF